MPGESQIQRVSTPAIRASDARGTRLLAIPDGSMPPGNGTKAGDPKTGAADGIPVQPRDRVEPGLRGHSHPSRLHLDGVPGQRIAAPRARLSPQ